MSTSSKREITSPTVACSPPKKVCTPLFSLNPNSFVKKSNYWMKLAMQPSAETNIKLPTYISEMVGWFCILDDPQVLSFGRSMTEGRGDHADIPMTSNWQHPKLHLQCGVVRNRVESSPGWIATVVVVWINPLDQHGYNLYCNSNGSPSAKLPPSFFHQCQYKNPTSLSKGSVQKLLLVTLNFFVRCMLRVHLNMLSSLLPSRRCSWARHFQNWHKCWNLISSIQKQPNLVIARCCSLIPSQIHPHTLGRKLDIGMRVQPVHNWQEAASKWPPSYCP